MAICGTFLAVAPAGADPPYPPFATASAACVTPPRSFSADTTLEGAPTTAPHDAVLLKFEGSQAGEGSTSLPPGGSYSTGQPNVKGETRRVGFTVGSVGWALSPPLAAGAAPSVHVTCSKGSAFKASWYDVPVGPASFTGTGAGLQFESDVAVRVPLAATYVADLTEDQSSTTTFLGPIGSGIPIAASAHSRGAWTMTLQPGGEQALAGLTAGARYVRPGGRTAASYRMIRPTLVSAWIVDSSGSMLRMLTDDAVVNFGDGTISWDGRGPAGTALPDGEYTLRVESHEPVRGTPERLLSRAEVPVVLDGSAPVVRIEPRRLGRRGHVVVAVTDALSGFSTATIKVDRREVARLQPTQRRFAFRPRGAWRTGRHRISVTASDVVGNTATTVRSFIVVQTRRAGRAR